MKAIYFALRSPSFAFGRRFGILPDVLPAAVTFWGKPSSVGMAVERIAVFGIELVRFSRRPREHASDVIPTPASILPMPSHARAQRFVKFEAPRDIHFRPLPAIPRETRPRRAPHGGPPIAARAAGECEESFPQRPFHVIEFEQGQNQPDAGLNRGRVFRQRRSPGRRRFPAEPALARKGPRAKRSADCARASGYDAEHSGAGPGKTFLIKEERGHRDFPADACSKNNRWTAAISRAGFEVIDIEFYEAVRDSRWIIFVWTRVFDADEAPPISPCLRFR